VGVAGYALYLNGHRVANVPAGQTTYFFKGLRPCSDYTLGVAAVDGSENYSRIEAVTTSTFGCPDQDMTPPSDPSGVHSFGETSVSIGLAWQPSTDNVGVTGYALFLNGARVANVPAGTTTYTFTLLSPCSDFTLGVAAVDATENYSNMVAVTATTSPGCPGRDTTPPSDPSGVYSSGETGTTITLNWQPSTDNVAVTGYALYLNGARVANVPYYAPTSHVFSGLTKCANFVLGVQAVDAANNYSNIVVIGASTSPGC
jgi:chitodextrinase